MNKYSFNISWNTMVERFVVQLRCNGEVIESKNFQFHSDVWDYVSETMCGLQIAGEDWTLSY